MHIGEVIREVEVLPAAEPVTLPVREPNEQPTTAPTDPGIPSTPVPA